MDVFLHISALQYALRATPASQLKTFETLLKRILKGVESLLSCNFLSNLYFCNQHFARKPIEIYENMDKATAVHLIKVDTVQGGNGRRSWGRTEVQLLRSTCAKVVKTWSLPLTSIRINLRSTQYMHTTTLRRNYIEALNRMGPSRNPDFTGIESTFSVPVDDNSVVKYSWCDRLGDN